MLLRIVTPFQCLLSLSPQTIRDQLFLFVLGILGSSLKVNTEGFSFFCSATLVRGMSMALKVYPLLLEMAEVSFESVRPMLAVLTLGLAPTLSYLSCDGCSDLDTWWLQETKFNQASRASLLNTQKNRKMKKP